MQLGPPYSLLERFNRFSHSQVSRVGGVVQFSQEQLAQPTPTRYDKLEHIVFGLTVHELKTMHISKAKICIIALGGGKTFFHFIVRLVLLQVIYLRQPGRFEHDSTQATFSGGTQPSTANKCELLIIWLERSTLFGIRPTNQFRPHKGNRITSTPTVYTTALHARHSARSTTSW